MSRTPYPRTDRELLQRIGRSAGSKAGYKQLVRELGLGGGRERRLLVEQLTRMVARGELVRLEDELWAIPKREPAAAGGVESGAPAAGAANRVGRRWDVLEGETRSGRDRLVSGRLDVHRDGFGFVRPDGTEGGRESREDIFIAPPDLNGAMQGDVVLVDEAPRGRDGRRSGRIARVLTRRNPTVVGLFHYARAPKRKTRAHADGRAEWDPATARENYVTPLDERMGGPIVIPEGDEVVPEGAEAAHRTLGDEALAQRRRAADEAMEAGGRFPLEGLAVDVEITRFPQPGKPALGRVLEVLGKPEGFGVDVEIVIRKHHIPHTFTAHVLAEAEDQARLTVEGLSPQELDFREDFRGLPIVTIDGETARDFDDAVLVRPLPSGNFELQVHIADVGFYVRPGSALDTEARVRGTSVYFPDRAVPMLPHALSSGMCSLRPDEDRCVLSCVMEIDPRGEVVGYRVTEGLIRSVRRMTYTSVQHCLNASPAAAVWNAHKRVTPEATAEDVAERERIAAERPELPEAVDRMLDLALRLNAKRVRRGSIDFDLPEPVVEFDPDGNMKAIVRSERGWAHRLIEEFMLSANECVATWLRSQEIASIYRIHELPDPKRIVEFEETASSFGASLGIGSLPVRKVTMKADRRENRRRSERGRGGSGRDGRGTPQHEIPESIPVTPQMYQRLVRKIAGKPHERILSYLMLRSLKQARYAEKNEGHFALASPCYTHFTSPIRRYPDLIVHRLLRAMLRRGANPVGGAILSDDPQPWGAASAKAGAGLRAGAERRSLPAAAERRSASHAADAGGDLARKTRRKRVEGERGARIGWSIEGADAGAVGAASVGAEDAGRFPALTDQTGEAYEAVRVTGDPIAAQELNDIAVESSQAERRAADAERELIEWKKMKFMADRVGDDFSGIILSVTKYGFFVELDELFVEGLVPLGSLAGDFYTFRDTDRTICGARTGHCFAIGDRVQVLLDRIDRQQRRLQFALLPGTEPVGDAGATKARDPEAEERRRAKKARAAERVNERKASAKRKKAGKRG